MPTIWRDRNAIRIFTNSVEDAELLQDFIYEECTDEIEAKVANELVIIMRTKFEEEKNNRNKMPEEFSCKDLDGTTCTERWPCTYGDWNCCYYCDQKEVCDECCSIVEGTLEHHKKVTTIDLDEATFELLSGKIEDLRKWLEDQVKHNTLYTLKPSHDEALQIIADVALSRKIR